MILQTKLAVMLMVALGIIYIFMASVIMVNTRSKYVYVYAGFFTCLGLWSLADGGMTMASDANDGVFFVKCIATMWISSFAFLTHSIFILSDIYINFSSIKRKLFIVLNYMIPIIILHINIQQTLLPSEIDHGALGWFPNATFFKPGAAFYVVITTVGFHIVVWSLIVLKNKTKINHMLSLKNIKILVVSFVIMLASLVAIGISTPNITIQAIVPKLGVIIAIIPVYTFFTMLMENNFSGIVSASFMFDVIDKFSEGLLLTNNRNYITYANNAFLEMTNHTDVIGKHIKEIIPICDGQNLDSEHSFEMKLDNQYIQLNYTLLKDDQNTIVGRFYLLQDITELKNTNIQLEQLNKSLEAKIQEATASLVSTNIDLKKEISKRIEMTKIIEEAARIDSLTALDNRMSFRKKVIALLEQCDDKNHAMLYMDLNKFKLVNDSYGHTIGDEVLKIFAKTLTEVFQNNEILGRIGGDEFVVFIPNITDWDIITSQCEQLFEKLKNPAIINGISIEITPSVGIAHYPTMAQDYNHLIKLSDSAMYYAKTKNLQKHTFIE